MPVNVRDQLRRPADAGRLRQALHELPGIAGLIVGMGQHQLVDACAQALGDAADAAVMHEQMSAPAPAPAPRAHRSSNSLAPASPKTPKTPKPSSAQDKEAPAAPRAYHHGHLRQALMEAAVAIIHEQGVEQLSVRETAKRAGVSPGAPFRHFASRAALLTAVAEQASDHLLARVQQALSAAEGEPPLQRLAAMGHAYLDWASAYPTHFRVISDRAQLDGGGSPAMTQANEGLRRQMRDLIAQALTPAASAKEQAQALVAARALVYGLARMAVMSQRVV